MLPWASGAGQLRTYATVGEKDGDDGATKEEEDPTPVVTLPSQDGHADANAQATTAAAAVTLPGGEKEEKEFDPRDFCCMSGCQNCVLYDEDFGKMARADPSETVEQDPSLAAFLAMERKMAEMSKGKH